MFLSPEIILEGYNKGLFPMADSFNDPFIYWVDPKERGIIKLNEFKVSRSLKKELKKNNFNVKVNKNFEKTINLCARNLNRKSTWINNQIIEDLINKKTKLCIDNRLYLKKMIFINYKKCFAIIAK